MSPAARMMWPFLRRHGWSLAGAGGGTVLLTAASLASPWPLKLVIDELLTDRPRPFALSSGDLFFLGLVTALILVIAAVKAVAEYYSDVWLKQSGEQIVHDLRVALYDHLQRLSLTFHDSQKKGNLVTRVTGDVNSVGALFSESLGEILSAVLLLAGMAIVTVFLDPILALATLGVVPFLFMVTSRYRERLKDLARRQRAEEGEIASLADEALGAMQVVKAFGSEDYEQGRVELRSKSRLQIGIVLSRTEARFSGLVDILGAVAAALVTAIGVFRVASGMLTPGDLIVFTSYASKTYKPLRDIARQMGKVTRAIARADRVAEILATDISLEDRPGAWNEGRAQGRVELRDVSFAYSSDRAVLDGITLNIPAGTRVAIVGPSGAGKSTLGALVARFYDPATGAVMIDGRDARDCALAWLRDQVGFLLQDTVLFSGTVAANISYATDASPDDVVAAARVAHAHEFISALPAGYDTELGQRGVGLSGGQRQRLGIARALLRNPPILVLDEPTVGLDAASEAEVVKGLNALMRGRTSIVISHSIHLARMADRVIVLEGGRIVEDGPPEELLREDGMFARLARTRELAARVRRHSRAALENGGPGHLTPRDPALPQMHRLLDVDEMAPVLRRSLRDGLRDSPLEELRIERVRYDPNRRVMVHYSTVVGGCEHHAVATVLAGQDLAQKVRKPLYANLAEIVDGRSPGARPAAHDSDIDAIITWLPFDARLPGVAVRASELLWRMAEEGVSTPDTIGDPVVVGYKPASRAVMRFGDQILKAYGKERQFDAAVTGLAVSGRADSIATAPFLGALSDLRLTVQAAVDGSPPSTAVESAATAGAFVAALQEQPADGLRTAPPPHQLREAARHAVVARAVVPQLERPLTTMIDGLERSMPAGADLTTAHGDFHVDQLMMRDGSFVCLDFDGMCVAPSALDLATYAADVVRGRPNDVAQVEEVLAPLVDGYGRVPDDLEWYLRAAILCRATHPFRAQVANWAERVSAMVAVAGEVRL